MNGTLPKSEVTRGDAQRLEALERYQILDAAPDPAMDDLAELAAKICSAPVAGISLAAANRICIHGRYGIPETELPLGTLPAAPPFSTQNVYEIPDTRNHPAFAPGGIFLSGRTFRFYAGAPLVTPTGVRVGALFVLDAASRRLTPFQTQTLTILGRQAMTTIELGHAQRQMDSIARSRQRIESALIVERNFVSTVLDTVDALVAVFDTAGRIVRFNRACETTSGYDFPSLVGRYLWDKLIPHSDVPAAIEDFERLRADGFPAAFENQWVHRDGSLRRIAWSASPLLDEQGNVNFIIATGIDVTVQRSAESTLRESEARYRQLVEGSLGMVCTHDLQGVLLSVNTHGAQSIGLTREEMTGHRLSEFMPEERRAAFDKYLSEIIRRGEVQGMLHLRHVDGEDPRHRLSQQAHRSPRPRSLRPRLRRRHQRAGARRGTTPRAQPPIRLHPGVRRRRHLRHRPRRPRDRHQSRRLADARLQARRVPRPEHARAHPPYPRRRHPLPAGRVPDSQHHQRPRHRPRLQRGLLAQGRHQLPGRIRRAPANRNPIRSASPRS